MRSAGDPWVKERGQMLYILALAHKSTSYILVHTSKITS